MTQSGLIQSLSVDSLQRGVEKEKREREREIGGVYLSR